MSEEHPDKPDDAPEAENPGHELDIASDLPGQPTLPHTATPESVQAPAYVPGEPIMAPRAARLPWALNLILFLLTIASTSYWGFIQYQSFYSRDLPFITPNPLRAPEYFIGGIPFALAVIAFLLSHEMGHYLACRFYGMAATLPFFIPFPPISLLPGTMGAVIRIVSPITSRRALFDIAIAGPIAGFIVALPILAVGIAQSRIVDPGELQAGGPYLEMSEPMMWNLMEGIFGPGAGPEQDLVVHPLAFVGWFALLVTAMNLLPVGQLDGGHILYALTARGHRPVSLLVLLMMVVAGVLFFPGWAFFAVIIFFLLGIRHPRPQRSDEPLGAARILFGLVAVAILVTSFSLVPIRLPQLLG